MFVFFVFFSFLSGFLGQWLWFFGIFSFFINVIGPVTLGQSLWKAFLGDNYLVLEPLLGGTSARASGRHFLMIITLFWSLSWGVGQSLWKAFSVSGLSNL